MTAIVTRETADDHSPFCSYIIRIYEAAAYSQRDVEDALVGYDTSTINLRAATEFIAMASRKHKVEPEDIEFGDGCYDLELSWKCYAEIR
jgi:hypothetical protein